MQPTTEHIAQQLAEVHQREAQERDATLMEAYPILEHFSFKHLPPNLQSASEPFHDMAWENARKAYVTVDTSHGRGRRVRMEPELAAGLRKLLEAKDCFVRARRVLEK